MRKQLQYLKSHFFYFMIYVSMIRAALVAVFICKEIVVNGIYNSMIINFCEMVGSIESFILSLW